MSTAANKKSLPASSTPLPRRRLRREDRDREIAQAAVAFFAEVGFDGDTRELARRLGVTQSLIFRYFPSKAALIERVYQEVYVGRWNPYWESIITDRTVPLQARLLRFYKDYARVALTYDWVRIFMFSGLRGENINARYLDFLRSRVLEPIAKELRLELGLPGFDIAPLTEEEVELIWGINARVFYLGQRLWVFNAPLTLDIDEIIDQTITAFLAGAKEMIPDLIRRSKP
ncbi:TetR/AcrR family transcriptional regulator [Polynucleobacter sinensis]|jgi:AcrR family transcriptional regulator|uniref:TetR/AcrR family transcriptional regulator n=1 Tax=Polynucleobacter sinensis TaxID=1743157 RepID=UPI000782C4A4|nr:TetR/AcrR family transcriptional regulator [Polynucleobacter sinensis]